MELALVIWAVGTLPALSVHITFLAFAVMFVSTFGFFLGKAITADQYDEESKTAQNGIAVSKISKRVFFFALPVWFIFLLVPDQKTAYQMLAAYGVQEVVTNEKVQEIAGDGVDVLQALMKKAKTELEAEAKQ